MNLCYIDESGTSDIPGNTSHFVLAGLSIPIWHWRNCDREVEIIKRKYNISDSEIHIAWILRPYFTQEKIPDFSSTYYSQRRSKVGSLRKAHILKIQKESNPKKLRQTRKNFRKSNPYIHLTYEERKNLVREIANCIANWGFARLFAECVDKIYFDPSKAPQTIDEQSFEQVVSRYEHYLQNISKSQSDYQTYGLLIHDNNQNVEKKHTELMKKFLQRGTFWTEVKNIIETPLFVDSQLTSMVQIVDVCAYALRRYLENGENELFDLVFQRADRKDDIAVGVRHFSEPTCKCKICLTHKRPSST